MQWMSVSTRVDTLDGKERNMVEEEDKKVRKAHINEDNYRQEMPNDRYDVRSRDCHATDAHTS